MTLEFLFSTSLLSLALIFSSFLFQEIKGIFIVSLVGFIISTICYFFVRKSTYERYRGVFNSVYLMSFLLFFTALFFLYGDNI